MVNPLDAILELFCQSGAMCVLDLSLWQDRLFLYFGVSPPTSPP